MPYVVTTDCLSEKLSDTAYRPMAWKFVATFSLAHHLTGIASNTRTSNGARSKL